MIRFTQSFGQFGTTGLQKLLDALCPPQCLADHCGEKAFRALPLCLACAKRLQKSLLKQSFSQDFLAKNDLVMTGNAEYLGSLFAFEAPVVQLIQGFKYRHQKRLASFLTGRLKFHPFLMEQVARYDYLLPVPLHPTRQRERGYNQASVIAEAASRITRVPVLENVLRRNRSSRSQTKFGRSSRAANAASLFRVTPKLAALNKNHRLLIVDDVLTTGATVNACLETLVKSGWDSSGLGVFTLAATPKNSGAASYKEDLTLAGSFLL